MSQAAEARFSVRDHQVAVAVFGQADRHLRLLEEQLGVRILSRGNELAITGEPEQVDQALVVLRELKRRSNRNEFPTEHEVRYAIRLAREGHGGAMREIDSEVVQVSYQGKPVRAKTVGQKAYVQAMRENPVVICIGPAGTGKTYLAIAMATALLKAREVQRLILTRPAVEAGERLGFLPGDLQEKVNPYLRPLYDALYDILGIEAFQRHVERGIIEVAPLAYMRGRTLDGAFVILDEAQNTTREQMKMFLTRLGFGSRMVVTGDVTQIDLPPEQPSGLIDACTVLRGIEGVGLVRLDEGDVVRHPLVQRIVRAYEQAAAGGALGSGPGGGAGVGSESRPGDGRPLGDSTGSPRSQGNGRVKVDTPA